MSLPPYRRSHLRSKTYDTLVRIYSLLPPSTASNQSLIVPPNNDNVEKGQENKEKGQGNKEKRQENNGKEPECTEVKVGSDVMDPKAPVPLKEIHDVRETIESVGDKSKDFSANEMRLDDIEFLMGRDEPSALANGFGWEQKLMDELELVVKGTEDPVCDDNSIPLDNKKQNMSKEFDLMDYRVELHSGTNASGSVSELQLRVPEELNQLSSKDFHVYKSKKGQVSDSVISTTSIKHQRQQKETELVKPVCPVVGPIASIQEGEFEKEEQYSHKVSEETHNSLDLDTNIEALNMTEDGGLLDSTTLIDQYEIQNGEKSEKLICVNNATNSSAILIEEGDLEEGEISGDFAMDGNTFDVSSADAIISEPMRVDEIQKPGNLFGNTVSPFKLGISFQGFPSNSFMSNAIQDATCNGQVESRTIKAIPTNLTQNQVLHKGFLEETTIKDHENSSAVQVIDASKERKSAPDSKEQEDMKKQMVDASTSKRGPGSQEKKARKKRKNRKNRAEKNRELGVKRLKLTPVQKPKAIIYCRHYMKGRCHEGDKCNFSHDTVPPTKSKPCVHFARHSCMKGDDCPFDHQLSKYPCSNFVSKGSCIRGHACLFSHQVPTNQDIPTPANVRKPELKSPFSSGNANFGTPLNNHGSSSVQQNHSTNSKGINSDINATHKVTESSQTQPTSVPKGIRFLNVANLSPSPSTPKQDTVTPNKGSLVLNVACKDKGQNTAEVPKKLPAVTPKGINFLSFGKSSVCSFKSSIRSISEEIILKLPQSVNFGLSEHSISSLNKDGYGKVSDRTPQTALFSHQILDKNESISERLKSKFLEKYLTDVSGRDQSHCKSVQEVKKASDNSQTLTVTSPTLLSRPFVSHLASEGLVSGYHNQASSSSQRALLSTLAFAADHESNIKMKCRTGSSPALSEEKK